MNENPSIENYTENNEWTLIAYKPFRVDIKYENWIENDSFSEIRYKILIRRKPLFVLQNCVIPAIMLCVLTLVSFFIPFAQEMQIGISIMLAFSVFKLRLSDDVPVQADSVPLINIYFTLCMSFSLTAMVWFSIMNLLRERKKVPKFCRYIVVNYFCKFLCARPSLSSSDTTKTGSSKSLKQPKKEQNKTKKPNNEKNKEEEKPSNDKTNINSNRLSSSSNSKKSMRNLLRSHNSDSGFFFIFIFFYHF